MEECQSVAERRKVALDKKSQAVKALAKQELQNIKNRGAAGRNTTESDLSRAEEQECVSLQLLRKIQSQEAEHVLINLFTEFDMDGSGSLETEEVPELLKAIGLPGWSVVHTQKLLNKMDRDQGGSVSLFEFIAFCNLPEFRHTIDEAVKRATEMHKAHFLKYLGTRLHRVKWLLRDMGIQSLNNKWWEASLDKYGNRKQEDVTKDGYLKLFKRILQFPALKECLEKHLIRPENMQNRFEVHWSDLQVKEKLLNHWLSRGMPAPEDDVDDDKNGEDEGGDRRESDEAEEAEEEEGEEEEDGAEGVMETRFNMGLLLVIDWLMIDVVEHEAPGVDAYKQFVADLYVFVFKEEEEQVFEEEWGEGNPALNDGKGIRGLNAKKRNRLKALASSGILRMMRDTTNREKFTGTGLRGFGAGGADTWDEIAGDVDTSHHGGSDHHGKHKKGHHGHQHKAKDTSHHHKHAHSWGKGGGQPGGTKQWGKKIDHHGNKWHPNKHELHFYHKKLRTPHHHDHSGNTQVFKQHMTNHHRYKHRQKHSKGGTGGNSADSPGGNSKGKGLRPMKHPHQLRGDSDTPSSRRSAGFGSNSRAGAPPLEIFNEALFCEDGQEFKAAEDVVAVAAVKHKYQSGLLTLKDYQRQLPHAVSSTCQHCGKQIVHHHERLLRRRPPLNSELMQCLDSPIRVNASPGAKNTFPANIYFGATGAGSNGSFMSAEVAATAECEDIGIHTELANEVAKDLAKRQPVVAKDEAANGNGAAMWPAEEEGERPEAASEAWARSVGKNAVWGEGQSGTSVVQGLPVDSVGIKDGWSNSFAQKVGANESAGDAGDGRDQPYAFATGSSGVPVVVARRTSVETAAKSVSALAKGEDANREDPSWTAQWAQWKRQGSVQKKPARACADAERRKQQEEGREEQEEEGREEQQEEEQRRLKGMDGWEQMDSWAPMREGQDQKADEIKAEGGRRVRFGAGGSEEGSEASSNGSDESCSESNSDYSSEDERPELSTGGQGDGSEEEEDDSEGASPHEEEEDDSEGGDAQAEEELGIDCLRPSPESSAIINQHLAHLESASKGSSGINMGLSASTSASARLEPQRWVDGQEVKVAAAALEWEEHLCKKNLTMHPQYKYQPTDWEVGTTKLHTMRHKIEKEVLTLTNQLPPSPMSASAMRTKQRKRQDLCNQFQYSTQQMHDRMQEPASPYRPNSAGRWSQQKHQQEQMQQGQLAMTSGQQYLMSARMTPNPSPFRVQPVQRPQSATTPDALHRSFAPMSATVDRREGARVQRSADKEGQSMQQLRYWSIVAAEQATSQKNAFGRDGRHLRGQKQANFGRSLQQSTQSMAASSRQGMRRAPSQRAVPLASTPCWGPSFCSTRPCSSD
jgi:hypothetical protein